MTITTTRRRLAALLMATAALSACQTTVETSPMADAAMTGSSAGMAPPVLPSVAKGMSSVASPSVGMAMPSPVARPLVAPPPPLLPPHPGMAPSNRAAPAEETTPNPVQVTAEQPVSTFSIDVDTAAYGHIRRMLKNGRLPPADAVRTEEMINYFPYAYPLPEDRDAPFHASVSVMPTPWNAQTKLLHVGIKGYDLKPKTRPPLNLVFLIDVSGSMAGPDRLDLLRQSLALLVKELKDGDKVGIVTYAGVSGVALEPTGDKDKILAALDGLTAGGSTAGAQGIQQAYGLAERNFDKSAVNRVILGTDGDFNVGASSAKELGELIAAKRKTGIYLSVLGVGMGNYNDAAMQKLAQTGNGQAAYIDSLLEARKVLSDQASTLFPIADDVKIQIEFNPEQVAEYRLIGYESRLLRREDFNNDKVDAGEIGSGHTVTALYEITPAANPARLVDALRYAKKQPIQQVKADSLGQEMAFLRLRYKLPGGSDSKLIERPITAADMAATLDHAPAEARFAAAVAAFGQKLRSDPYLKDYGWSEIQQLAQSGRGTDIFGYRGEFLQLVRTAESLNAVKR